VACLGSGCSTQRVQEYSGSPGYSALIRFSARPRKGKSAPPSNKGEDPALLIQDRERRNQLLGHSTHTQHILLCQVLCSISTSATRANVYLAEELGLNEIKYLMIILYFRIIPVQSLQAQEPDLSSNSDPITDCVSLDTSLSLGFLICKMGVKSLPSCL
jgi:hypothetical protein